MQYSIAILAMFASALTTADQSICSPTDSSGGQFQPVNSNAVGCAGLTALAKAPGTLAFTGDACVAAFCSEGTGVDVCKSGANPPASVAWGDIGSQIRTVWTNCGQGTQPLQYISDGGYSITVRGQDCSVAPYNSVTGSC